MKNSIAWFANTVSNTTTKGVLDVPGPDSHCIGAHMRMNMQSTTACECIHALHKKMYMYIFVLSLYWVYCIGIVLDTVLVCVLAIVLARSFSP